MRVWDGVILPSATQYSLQREMCACGNQVAWPILSQYRLKLDLFRRYCHWSFASQRCDRNGWFRFHFGAGVCHIFRIGIWLVSNKMEGEVTSKRKRDVGSLFSFSLLHVDRTMKESKLKKEEGGDLNTTIKLG